MPTVVGDRSRGLGANPWKWAFVALLACQIVFWGGGANWVTAAPERYERLQLFTKVLNLVQQYYVEPVDIEKLVEGGIKGMLRELDPHTNYLPPDIYKEFESETSGEFGGLGIEITVQKGILTIISPIEDTPAYKAGIKAGDKIVKIDNVSTKGMSLVEAAKFMRGKKGSPVVLTIFRDGFEEPRDFKINRGVVKIKSVKFQDLGDGYGYYRVTSFIENTFDDLKKTLDQQLKSRDKVSGIILDLRRNPGGLLDQAVKMSDLFLEEGTIVSTVDRNKKQKEVISAKREGTLKDFPIVVLIDEYSASASEIVAGALQDNRRALVMGQRSFGKGSVQSVVALGDGSGLKLTVARYYTPSGRSIQSEGVTPDVTVDSIDPEALDKAKIKTDIERERDMKNHLLGEAEEAEAKSKRPEENFLMWWGTDTATKKTKLSEREKLLKNDFQVFQAYNYLRAYKVMKSM
jgi:carboxyl-terminal processing protease